MIYYGEATQTAGMCYQCNDLLYQVLDTFRILLFEDFNETGLISQPINSY
jgi:hypothetical protein